MADNCKGVEKPQVTVLMTAYNAEAFVCEAVQSILNQSFDAFELVIINDGSTDETRNILQRISDPRIRLIDNRENLGLARTGNIGLAAARGELIARLDADDIIHSDRLAKQVHFMREHPDVALVGGQIRAIDVNGRRLRRAEFPRPVTAIGIAWYSLFDSPFCNSASMYRRAVVWEDLGGYDPAWVDHEDAELWMRLMKKHRVANLPDVLVDYRFHGASVTRTAEVSDYVERRTVYSMTNMRRVLRGDVPEEWARLSAEVISARQPISREAATRFAAVLDEIERRFVRIYPEAAQSSEVSGFKAELLSRAMFAVAPSSRTVSLRIFRRMVLADARTALKVLPKYVVYFGLKSKTGRLLSWWRGCRNKRRMRNSA